MGVVLRGSLGAVQWKATDLEVISGCGPVGMDHCKSLGVVWRGSVGVVQWARSSGCSPVGVSQDESVEHKGSQKCGLEGNSGCGLVGD